MKLLKNRLLLPITILCVLGLSACNGNTSPAPANTPDSKLYISEGIGSDLKADNSNTERLEPNKMIAISVTAGGKVFSAQLYDNESAKAITAQMPFTLDMKDFSGQEKVASLSFELPIATTQMPATISSGELYLWSGNQLVLFYTSFSLNAYSYVPIGYIEDSAELTEALGSGNVAVTFRATEGQNQFENFRGN